MMHQNSDLAVHIGSLVTLISNLLATKVWSGRDPDPGGHYMHDGSLNRGNDGQRHGLWPYWEWLYYPLMSLFLALRSQWPRHCSKRAAVPRSLSGHYWIIIIGLSESGNYYYY